MSDAFSLAVEDLIRRAPSDWCAAVCEALTAVPPTASADFVLQRLPSTNNADLSFAMREVVRTATPLMSWEALSWSISTSFSMYYRWCGEQQIELVWSGPSPADRIPARRIDQALYDIVANARANILLVTFAAAKIARLSSALLSAAQRGVRIRLVLEFEETSEGQLSYDALKAFAPILSSAAEVYYWPVEKRERNQAGKPGKLHAKLAIVDDLCLVSSANLTDDAFNRNLEVGVMVRQPAFLSVILDYFDALIATGTLCRL